MQQTTNPRGQVKMGDDMPATIALEEVWRKEDAPDLNCWVCLGEHCDYVITRFRVGGRCTNGAHGLCLMEMIRQSNARKNASKAAGCKPAEGDKR